MAGHGGAPVHRRWLSHYRRTDANGPLGCLTRLAALRFNSLFSEVLFYGIIVIRDIPHVIAEKRPHPHQDAIYAAGWVSLFTLHALSPFLCRVAEGVR
jgi:hypothetical protein